MGETKGRGTPGSGSSVSRGTALGGISVWEQEQEGPPGEEVWWGHNEKKKETNTSCVLCCDETSIILEVIMPQFTLSLQLWRKCIPSDLSYQCLHESGWSWKC